MEVVFQITGTERDGNTELARFIIEKINLNGLCVLRGKPNLAQ